MTPEFDQALARFMERTQAALAANHARHFPHVKVPVLSADRGKRYVRIAKTEGSSRAVHCFVDMTNGDVLKPDGWKRPAKGARGNIYQETAGSVSTYGTFYTG